MELIAQPDRATMLNHLEWLCDPVRAAHPDLRLEIAYGAPDKGPSSACTFRLDEINDAASFAASINARGFNVYVGVTLKRADTPAKGRTRSEHACLATCLPIDFDSDFTAGARKLGNIAKPQLLVVTGREPESRGQLWIGLDSTTDLKIWTELNRRSAFFSGGDPNALGTYRLMRLAGTVSYPPAKKMARGYCVELTMLQSVEAPSYDVHDLLDRFPAADPTFASDSQKPFSTRKAGMYLRPPVNGVNVSIVSSMLSALPDCYAIDHGLWLRTGFALHDFDVGEFGLSLWECFSDRCQEKANRTDFVSYWSSFGREYQGKKIGLDWLWRHAQAHGWCPPRRWDRFTTIRNCVGENRHQELHR